MPRHKRSVVDNQEALNKSLNEMKSVFDVDVVRD